MNFAKSTRNSQFRKFYLQQFIQDSQGTTKAMNSKLNWTCEEQQSLKKIVQNKKDLTWNQIAMQMNKQYPQKCRTGKQYRQRYVNYVQFEKAEKKNNNWSIQEQKALFKQYREMGTKWTIIAKIISSKSENSLKNKFYGALRKALRKINRIGKQNIKKFNKPIRYQSLIRIMDAAEGGQDLLNDIKINSEQIKEKILDMAEHCQEDFNIQSVSDAIKEIHKFNIATRCYSSKKWKRQSGSHSESKFGSSMQNSISMEQQVKSEQASENRDQQKRSPNSLQQNRRFYKENIQIKLQKQQTGEGQAIKIEEVPEASYIKVSRKSEYMSESQAEEIVEKSKDDLQFDLCGILKQEYVPRNFSFFQQ